MIMRNPQRKTCNAKPESGPVVVLMLSLGLLSLIASPCLGADRPSTTQRFSDALAAYAHLTDADPIVRQSAQQQLMRIQKSELPRLRQAVEEDPPAPAQIPALHQAVTGAMLASSDYASDSRRGFLGITLGQITLENGAQRVVVQSRLAGFVGWRMLQAGDIFVAVVGSKRIAIDDVTALQQAILGQPAGARLTLVVLRGGRVVRVPVTLDAVPEATGAGAAPNLPPDPAQFQAMQATRLAAAQDYWEKHFAPLCRSAAQ
jgi:hypothetical protein